MLKKFPPLIKSIDLLADYQLKNLQNAVKYAWENSPFYRQKFAQAHVTPDDIKTLDDIQRLPFTTADDLKNTYPFALLSAPMSKIVRIHSSSGTTGKRKIISYTQKDIDDWAYMFGRCYEMAGLTELDRVQICVGYGLWTAGVGFQNGCERFGALAIPVGPGNIELQLTFLMDLQPTVICSTASMALLLAEEVYRQGLKSNIAVKKVICGAERMSESMAQKIKEFLGIEQIYDITGLTELYGPGTGLSCEYSNGIHYWADFYYMELINPETLRPVFKGEIGEMVYTTFFKEGAPLIRYRSRDLTRMLDGDCPCGCFLPRHDRILGRSDDMFIFRGVNIYPGQIDEILSQIKQLGSEYQIHLDRNEDGKDYMTIKVERALSVHRNADKEIADKVIKKAKHSLLVSCNVEILDYGSLPRTDRKSKRLFDNRGL